LPLSRKRCGFQPPPTRQYQYSEFMMRSFQPQRCAIAAAMCAAGMLNTAHATNGMNMEGYGPIATGMGGAATAYDNGTAAMANNPATLQLAPVGHRVDGAVGMLGPDVTSYGSKSTGTSYVMPALGWSNTSERTTWGVGLFAQGGMGTEFSATSNLAMDGQASRSELGVGRLIFPLAYRVNDKLTIGGSLDYVWAGLDMQMVTTPTNFGTMVGDGTSALGASTLPFAAPPGASSARLNFSDNNDFTGAAKGTGFGGKLGMTYALSDALVIGASYHTKTQLSDMETGDNAASVQIDGSEVMTGKITVRDFQWPATTAIGMSWKATPDLQIVADIKHIAWSDTMESFKMTFSNAGGYLNFAMPQQWKDQTVTMLGAAYKVSDKTTVRGGVNLASNPVPEALTHPLFPAIVKSHYTMGFGHQIDRASSIDASLSLAPKVNVIDGNGGTITHSQTNFQLMYSYRY
jgi:long-chain fatty acid transport protein